MPPAARKGNGLPLVGTNDFGNVDEVVCNTLCVAGHLQVLGAHGGIAEALAHTLNVVVLHHLGILIYLLLNNISLVKSSKILI